MSDLCTWCGEPIKQPEGAGRRRKFCSDECSKQKNYSLNKSVYAESGMGECGPIGFIEGEHVTTSWAGSYEEHYVDPAILAQAELIESNIGYANEIQRSKNKGIQMRRDGGWSKPVSPRNLNRFV